MVLLFLAVLLLVMVAVFVYLKNVSKTQAPKDDDSTEAIKKEMATLMTELKKLYEKNAALIDENQKLSAKVKDLEKKQ